MKKRLTLLLLVLLMFAVVLAGCRTGPDIREVKDIPTDAVEIMTSELLGQSGTYTKGSIYVSGNGYFILDIQLQSGSVKSVGIIDATLDETIFAISKPNTALYDSGYYEYKADSEYKLSFVDAKEINGTITVYYVPE